MMGLGGVRIGLFILEQPAMDTTRDALTEFSRLVKALK